VYAFHGIRVQPNKGASKVDNNTWGRATNNWMDMAVIPTEKTMSELATQISNKFLSTFEYLKVKSGVIKNLDFMYHSFMNSACDRKKNNFVFLMSILC